MNKGLKHVNGDYVIFLNSGDSFHDDSVIEDFIKNDFNEPVVYGNCISTRDDYSSFYESIFPNELTLLFFYKGMLNHQSIFYHKDCFKTFRYDEKYKICADKHLTLKLFYNGYAFRYWNRFISIYNNGEGLTNRNPQLTESESIQVFYDLIPEYITKDYIRFNQMLDVDLFKTTKDIVDSNKIIRTIARIVLYPFRLICHAK